MKATILYRPNSEFARKVEEYVRDFSRTRSQPVELIDMDSPAGAAIAQLYEFMQYPTLFISREDGQLLKDWQGIDQFPLMNELAVYLNS